MSRAQRVVLIVAVVAALILTGIGVVAAGNEGERGACLERSTRVFEGPRGSGAPGVCLAYAPDPEPSEPLPWFVGAAAALVVGGVAMVLVKDGSP